MLSASWMRSSAALLAKRVPSEGGRPDRQASGADCRMTAPAHSGYFDRHVCDLARGLIDASLLVHGMDGTIVVWPQRSDLAQL